MKVVEYEEYEEEEAYRKAPKKKKRKFGFYGYLVMLLAFAILVISFLLIFYVQRIEISGNEYSPKENVVEWVKQDKLSFNSLYVWGKYKLGKMPELSYVDSIELTLKNPWTIAIRIYEKSIVGYLIFNNQYVYFDKEGQVLVQSSAVMDGIPCIEGIEVNKVHLYERLPVKDKKVFSYILDVTQAAQKCALVPDRIVCTNMDVSLYFGGTSVFLGHENLGDRMRQVPPILERLGGQPGTLHLENYQDNSESISFQKEVLPEESVLSE
ncbi:MAG: hypothetical protein RR275_01480 [Lachnospiraceae bacterium]